MENKKGDNDKALHGYVKLNTAKDHCVAVMFCFSFGTTNFLPITVYLLMPENISCTLVLCIGQNLGQNLCYREKFDVAVARAVAEMRILGTIEDFPDNSILCCHDTQ